MGSAVLDSDALKTLRASGCGINLDFRRERGQFKAQRELEKAQLALAELATTDPLTGVL
ncbi:MAG: hypothetical protein ACLP5H_32920 [Desulfomonilaceae bacterium]